jgi:hypothetical protein
LKRRFVTNFAAQQEMMMSSSMSRCLFFFFFQKYLRIEQIWQTSLRRVFVLLRVVPMMRRGVDDDDDEAF